MTLTIQERAAILRLKLERERRERIRRSTLVVARGRQHISEDDVRDLMNDSVVADLSTAVVDADGNAIPCERKLRATGPDEMLRIRDGKRRRATRYANLTRTGKPTSRNRLSTGVKLLDAMLAERGGPAEPMPERGMLPCPPVDTMAHGRSTDTMRYRAALADTRGSQYVTRTTEGRTFTFDRFSGEVVTFEPGAIRSTGDWRDPSTDTVRRARYAVPTGEFV